MPPTFQCVVRAGGSAAAMGRRIGELGLRGRTLYSFPCQIPGTGSRTGTTGGVTAGQSRQRVEVEVEVEGEGAQEVLKGRGMRAQVVSIAGREQQVESWTMVDSVVTSAGETRRDDTDETVAVVGGWDRQREEWANCTFLRSGCGCGGQEVNRVGGGWCMYGVWWMKGAILLFSGFEILKRVGDGGE